MENQLFELKLENSRLKNNIITLKRNLELSNRINKDLVTNNKTCNCDIIIKELNDKIARLNNIIADKEIVISSNNAKESLLFNNEITKLKDIIEEKEDIIMQLNIDINSINEKYVKAISNYNLLTEELVLFN